MNIKKIFINSENIILEKKSGQWLQFLTENDFDFQTIQQINMSDESPVIMDKSGNKFSIDFVNDKVNYTKKKSSIKTELISKALGGGKFGLNILDLSAGLGIDAVFLAQLGYSVIALERNPLIYLALNEALQQKPELNLSFIFSDALTYLKSQSINTDVIYFDPMFPEKAKSALPRQEMVFFRSLVGHDADAAEVLDFALKIKSVKRVVVKRPIKAPALMRPMSSIEGKLIRFDLYRGVRI